MKQMLSEAQLHMNFKSVVCVIILYENIDQILPNKFCGPMHHNKCFYPELKQLYYQNLSRRDSLM